jgi:dihydroorotate dehydrogenase (NAD+) catalytic subunit
MNWKDIIEFMIAGASAVQIGTLNFIDPMAPEKMIKELEDYCVANKVAKLSELTASYII